MSLPWRLNKLARKKRDGPSDTEALFGAQKNGAVGGDAVARRVETVGGHVLHKGVTAGDGNPLGTLVVDGRRRRAQKKSTPKRAHTRKRRPLARASGANLKVSRAVEKLAHLISNGSFNNIPRHLLSPCRTARASADCVVTATSALTVLYFRDAPDSPRPDEPKDKNVSFSFRRCLPVSVRSSAP